MGLWRQQSSIIILLHTSPSGIPSPHLVIPNEVRNLPRGKVSDWASLPARFLTSFGMTDCGVSGDEHVYPRLFAGANFGILPEYLLLSLHIIKS